MHMGAPELQHSKKRGPGEYGQQKADLEDVMEGAYELRGQELLPAVIAALDNDRPQVPALAPAMCAGLLNPRRLGRKPASMHDTHVVEGTNWNEELRMEWSGCNGAHRFMGWEVNPNLVDESLIFQASGLW